MTDLPRWRLGEPLAVTLDNLATGREDTTTIELGRIVWSGKRRCAAFEPAGTTDARVSAVPLSPLGLDMNGGLKLGNPLEFDGLHGVFADSLPDGWGRLLVDREAEARGLRRSDLTPVDRLAIVGAGGMGALDYRPAADAKLDSPETDLAALADTAQRILGEAGDPSLADALDLRAALGGSGGARPKIVCQIEEVPGDAARLRPATAPTHPNFAHWLVKFPAREDGPHSAATEAAYAEMARVAGIDMPDTRLVKTTDGRHFFAIRRFDRDVVTTAEGVRLRRRHMLSASAGLDSEPRKFAFDYTTLLAWVWHLTRTERAVEEAFRRAAFNAMAHNRDDHGRQHSAILDIDDLGRWRWQLSPAYDLTPSDGPGGEHSLSIGGAGRDIARAHLQTLASGSPVRRERASEILDQVAESVSQWARFADASGLPGTAADRVKALHQVV